MSARSRLRRIALDLTPLRVSHDFRLLWTGMFVSQLGTQFARVAIYVQVFALTGSYVAVGLTGLIALGALFLGTVIASTFIDSTDRRWVLAVSQIAYGASATVLLVTALASHPPLWPIYAANAATAFISAIDSPSRQAMTVRLVGRELVPSALALNQVLWQTTMVAGPALGGIVINTLGLSWAYGIDLVTYGALFVAAMRMQPMPPQHEIETGWGAVREGFGYVRRDRLLQSTFVIDLVAMIFGMPAALFPGLAITQFHRGPEVVGYLLAAPAVGALLQALAGGWVGRVRRQGVAIVWAVAGWGAAIAAFGVVGSNLPLALCFLAIAGAADVISAIFRSTITQVSVPDRLRGRLQAIFTLVVTGGPRLGDFEAGVVARAFTPTISVVSGGVACIVGAAAVTRLYPQLWSHRADAEPDVPSGA